MERTGGVLRSVVVLFVVLCAIYLVAFRGAVSPLLFGSLAAFFTLIIVSLPAGLKSAKPAIRMMCRAVLWIVTFVATMVAVLFLSGVVPVFGSGYVTVVAASVIGIMCASGSVWFAATRLRT